MTPKWLSIFMILSGGLLFLIFWAASIGFVYWDVYRRNMPWRQQIVWIAVVALLPLLGFFVYLFARFVSPSLPGGIGAGRGVQKMSSSLMKKRETMAMRVPGSQIYLPTIAVETASADPAASVKSATQPGPFPGRDRPAFTFSLLSGPGARREFVIKALPAIIGRSTGATVLLDADPSVSRQHAEIYERGGWLFIRDLDSKHGTQVNGVWISDQRLETGDEVLIGDSLLVLNAGENRGR
jgi:pSer/pThr/pTyr-binding forkhead associated (FHA) protein